MIVSEFMTKNVISVRRSTPVSKIAGVLLTNKISAVPVIDDDGSVVGIVSEDDLLRRRAAGQGGSWWLRLLANNRPQPDELVKARDITADQVMTRHVVTTRENAPAGVVGGLLRRYRIKRIPVVRGKKLVGIVSRVDLLNALFRGKPRS